jgi:carbon-monoxide dehydrogenase small subunit
MSDMRSVSITVNGSLHTRDVETRRTLGDFLRLDLGLTGTHLGCEHGACGACTVRVEGEAVRSCLMLAVQANGKHVATVEGLARDGKLNPLQQAFWERHGLQCGFCTPGILMTLSEFLEENQSPSEAEIRDALSGNICRCTGYQAIVDAALDAAGQMKQASEAA